MRVGMLARAEERGLGILTYEWWRNMRPDKTLVVVPDGAVEAGTTSHLEWYPGATFVRYGHSPLTPKIGELDEKRCRAWLEDLDVVYSAETFYDQRFCYWAREAGVATVCHAMPEFARAEWFDGPTVWWAPTSWRLDALAPTTRQVPVPIPMDLWRPTERRDDDDRPIRWLHIAGAATIQDRNGTEALMRAVPLLRQPAEITVASQTTVELHASTDQVTVTGQLGTLTDYWELYEGFDALVMPRRYAGLCLPVLEAMGAGLAVVMSDMEPQRSDWPVQTVRTEPGDPIKMAGGMIETGNVDPSALAALMDSWASNPAEVRAAQSQSRAYARANSWVGRRDKIQAELSLACDIFDRSQKGSSVPPNWFATQVLGATPNPKLQIGCGYEPIDGWVNLDAAPSTPADWHGPADKLPWADDTFVEIRAVDILEHFSYRDTERVLTEWARVLAPGGRMYVQVPDAENMMQRYLSNPATMVMPEFEGLPPIVSIAWRILGGHADGQYVSDDDDWRWNAHYALFSLDSLAWYAEKVGLKVESIVRNPHPNVQAWLTKP